MNFPDSMADLPEQVKEKAIEIANTLIIEESIFALLREKSKDEGTIVKMAISRAKELIKNRDMNTEKKIQATGSK